MTTRLILRIDEHWPTTPLAAWVLLDPDGEVQAAGESDPRHWPAADRCEVLLAGAQCLWLEAVLPRASRRDAQRLLAYALEDRLLSDPDSQHLSISHRRPAEGGEMLGVLVVARERMRHLLAQLKAIGREPAQVFSELQSAPASDGSWHVALSAGEAILRVSPVSALAIDGELLGPVISQQLAAARSENCLPGKIVVHLAPGLGAPDLPDEAKPELGAAYLWWQGLDGAAPINLLHGEFAVAGRSLPLLSGLRRPVQLLLLMLLVWLLADLGEVIWLRHRLGDIQERQARTFQTSFPNTPAIAPLAQMRQHLNLARARHGLLRDDDALAMLAVLGEALAGQASDNLLSVDFADGRLEVGWRAFPAADLVSLKTQLAARGLLVDTRDEGGVSYLIVRPEVLP